MISIPQNNQWKQLNSGEVFGDLYSTRNISLDEEGYLKLGRKSTAILNNTANLGSICSIHYINTASNAGYYIMTSDHTFRYTTGATITDINTATRIGGATFDGCPWQGEWYYTQDIEFRHYDGSSISSALGTLTTGKYHPVCVFENLNYLAVGDGNLVKLYSASYTGTGAATVTITLPSNFEVRWMVWKNNLLHIGTKNLMGEKAMLFTADGASSSASGGFAVDGSWLYSGCAYGSTVACVSSNGQLLEFNQGGFNELAVFPVYTTNLAWINSFVHGSINHRGMIADGETIYLNVDSVVGNYDTYMTNFPSGLWTFTPTNGLYHRAGNGFNKLYNTTATVDTSTDIFTIASNTSPTGTAATFYNASNDTGGLVSGETYFLIRLSATTFQLATSYDNAIAGTYIDITSSGTARTFYFQENDESGRVVGNNQPGAIQLISDLDNISAEVEMTRSTVLYGNRTISNNTIGATVPTLTSLTRGFNIGSLITTKIQTQNFADVWQAIASKFDRLFEGNEKITLKYRTKKKRKFPVVSTSLAATWITATQFTTTKDLSLVEIGDEVEFIDGRCSGYSVHITSKGLTNPSGTWVVGIDETLPNVTAGDKSYFVIDNWTKAGTVTKATALNVDSLFRATTGPSTSKWIQVKVEIRGVSEPVIEGLQVINETKVPSA